MADNNYVDDDADYLLISGHYDASSDLPMHQAKMRGSFCSWRGRACGAGTLLLLLAFVLTAIFAVPAIIEQQLSGAKVELGVLNLTNPTESSLLLSCDAALVLKSAPPLPFRTPSSHLRFCVRNANGNGWINVGKLHLPALEGKPGRRTLSLQLRNAEMRVTNIEGWTRFTRSIVADAEVRWRLEGHIDVAVRVLGTFFTYRHNQVLLDSKSAGCNGFTDPFPFIESYDALSDSLEEFPTQLASVRLFNPSDFQILPLGVMVMDMRFKGSSMGWVTTTTNITLYKGWNSFYFMGPLEPDNITDVSILMSRFYGGLSSNVVMHISNYSHGTQLPGAETGSGLPACSNSLYSAALDGFDIPTKLAYAEGKYNLTTEAVWQTRTSVVPSLLESNASTVFLPLWAGLLNPFSSHMYITASKCLCFDMNPKADALVLLPLLLLQVPSNTTINN